MRSKCGMFVSACALVMVFAGMCCAAITYDQESDTIVVSDFPAELPATPSMLLKNDQMSGWGKVSYDKANDAYTVGCNLQVGMNDGTNTYFQIGSKQQPKETLVMKGHLLVCPYWIKGRNQSSYREATRTLKKVNRITLGDPEDASVTPALKFDCEKRFQYTLMVGMYREADGAYKSGYLGQFHAYNTLITAATQDKAHMFGSSLGKKGTLYFTGRSVILDHCTISWCGGYMTYGTQDANGKRNHIVFENGGVGIYNGQHTLAGSTFRNLELGVRDGGGLRATLTDCTFENNLRNWQLCSSGQYLVCIDCTYDTPKNGNEYRARIHGKTKELRQAYFASKRHVVVEAVDGAGKPVPGAKVTVACEQTPALWQESVLDMLENKTRTTGANGRTAAKGEERPILLVEVTKRGTKEPNKPEVTEFSYTITADSKGATGEVKGFRPKQSWEVLRLTLKK